MDLLTSPAESPLFDFAWQGQASSEHVRIIKHTKAKSTSINEQRHCRIGDAPLPASLQESLLARSLCSRFPRKGPPTDFTFVSLHWMNSTYIHWYILILCPSFAWPDLNHRPEEHQNPCNSSLTSRPHFWIFLDAAGTPWDSSFPAASTWIHLVFSTKLQVVLDGKNIQKLWELWRPARCERLSFFRAMPAMPAMLDFSPAAFLRAQGSCRSGLHLCTCVPLPV